MKNGLKQLWSCPVAVSSGIALISALALAVAFSAQIGLNMEPCILCLYQRIPYAICFVFGLSGLALRHNPRAVAALVALSALAFLINAGIGLYHVGVEERWWVSAVEGCAVPKFDTSEGSSSILDQILKTPSVPCDQVAWRDSILGLSMAAYNALLCLFLGINCAVAALKIRQR